MILSTKGRYAVMAMVDLAANQDDSPVTLSLIADRQEIPLAYLEQLFSRLKRAGLVDSVRGPKGGYLLNRDANDIAISEIILASDESLEMTRCGSASDEGCMSPKTRCLTHDLWEGLTNHIRDYLQSITLEDVCNRKLPALRTAVDDKLIQVVNM